MPSIRLNPAISFYATKAEVATWLTAWVHAFELHALFVTFLKGGIHQEIPWDRPAGVRKLVGTFDGVLLAPHSLHECDRGDKAGLSERNPECLYIDFPRLRNKGLTPGHLGSIAKAAGCLRVYRRIGGELVKSTNQGVWFVNATTRKKWFTKQLRYSPGIEKAVREGLLLFPEGGPGRSSVHLDEPAEPDSVLSSGDS